MVFGCPKAERRQPSKRSALKLADHEEMDLLKEWADFDHDLALDDEYTDMEDAYIGRGFRGYI